MSTKQPIWPSGRFGVPQITPFTYRDGHTHLELIEALRDHVVERLHPSLVSTVNSLVEQMEAEYGKALDQYVNGVEEFQRIHDAFMSDVNAHLIALNDGAVSDLVNDDTSLLGATLRDMFAQRDVVDQRFAELPQYLTPYMFGATSPGLSVDNTGPIRDMFNYAREHHGNGAHIHFPEGTWVVSSGTITLWSGLTITGVSKTASTLRHTGSEPMFTFDGQRYDLVFESLRLHGGQNSTLFHIDTIRTGPVSSVWRDMKLTVQGTENQLINMTEGTFIHNTFDNCVMERSQYARHPGLYFASTDSGNGNQFRNTWMHSHNNILSPFVEIRSIREGSYVYDWLFDGITGEQNGGGLLHFYGAAYTKLRGCYDYDLMHTPGYQDDLFKFDVSDQGLICRNIDIQSSGRIGRSMDDHAYDIFVHDTAQFIKLENSNSSPGIAKLNVPESRTILLNTGGGSYSPVTLPAVVFAEMGTRANTSHVPGKMIYESNTNRMMYSDGEQWHPITLDTDTPPITEILVRTIGNSPQREGIITFDQSLNKLVVYDGETWRDAFGDPV